MHVSKLAFLCLVLLHVRNDFLFWTGLNIFGLVQVSLDRYKNVFQYWILLLTNVWNIWTDKALVKRPIYITSYATFPLLFFRLSLPGSERLEPRLFVKQSNRSRPAASSENLYFSSGGTKAKLSPHGHHARFCEVPTFYISPLSKDWFIQYLPNHHWVWYDFEWIGL